MVESTRGLRVLKLINNDELIGVVEDGVEHTTEGEAYSYNNLLFVSSPMKIVTEYDPTTKVHALYLVDWVPAIKDSVFPIDKQKVLTLGDPNPDLEKHYVDLVMAEKLYQAIQKAQGGNNYDGSMGEDGHDIKTEGKTDKELSDKLKKHKFDDDDIQ